MIRRRRRTAGIVVLLILLAVAYVAACALAPMPAMRTDLTAEPERQLAADAAPAAAAVEAQTLPTAIGWASGEEVWSNDDTAYALGSVSKLITVLVAMEAQPLEPGADGPTYTWTAADRERQNYYLSLNGVAYPIPVGTEITLREMLQFIFLPSSNDYAAAYAYWVFGDNDTFVAAVDDFAARHGLESLTLVEPTGMDDGNRASAADLVRIARLAIDNPTIREFNGMQSAVMPWGVGLIENTNPLLGVVPGVIGVKTGMLSTVGYNLIAAQEADAFGRSITNISVTLARPSSQARAESGLEMLTLMANMPQQIEVVAAGEEVGTVVTPSGESVRLMTVESAHAVLLPGETAARTIELTSVAPGPAGSSAGVVRVTSPDGEFTVPVVTAGEVVEPDLWWRLTNPLTLWGQGGTSGGTTEAAQ